MREPFTKRFTRVLASTSSISLVVFGVLFICTPAFGAPPVHDCDRFAAHPLDELRVDVPGVEFSSLTDTAVEACLHALEDYPDEPRFLFQLGRAKHAHGETNEALRLYELAANLGYPQAAVSASVVLFDQFDIDNRENPSLVDRAFSWLKRAAEEQNSVVAQGALFGRYLEDDYGQQNYDLAFKWAERGAENGDKDAYTLLYLIYSNVLAKRVLGELAEQLNLSEESYILPDIPTYERETADVIEWIEREATRGDKKLQLLAGMAYWHGISVPKNEHKGLNFIKKAADNGMPEATRIYRRLTGN